MYLDIVILVLMVASALWTAMAANLLKSAIGLAVTSMILAIIMFRFHAPLAAVFELSVCAGLITVVFVSVISLTQPSLASDDAKRKSPLRYLVLPLVVLITGVALAMMASKPELISSLAQPQEADVRNVLWGQRSLDLFGQVVVLLVGVFGVVVLFKQRGNQK